MAAITFLAITFGVVLGCRAQPRQSFLLIHKKFAHHRRHSKARQSGVDCFRGGKWDNLIDEKNWKEARVVYSEEEAAELGLEIDHDDTHAAFGTKSFALLLHGTQPKGSAAAEALKIIKERGCDEVLNLL